jgi:hypothetical protein
MGFALDIKKVLLYLVVFFVLVSIWNNPTDSAHTASLYLVKVGHFFVAVFDRLASFIKGLSGKS